MKTAAILTTKAIKSQANGTSGRPLVFQISVCLRIRIVSPMLNATTARALTVTAILTMESSGSKNSNNEYAQAPSTCGHYLSSVAIAAQKQHTSFKDDDEIYCTYQAPAEIENNLEDRPLQTDGMKGQSRCISDGGHVAYPQSGNCILTYNVSTKTNWNHQKRRRLRSYLHRHHSQM